MTFVTQCSLQCHSQIYRVGDRLKVLVILPAASRFLRWKHKSVFCQDLHASDSFYRTRPDYVVLH